jgi:hypothetical protein
MASSPGALVARLPLECLDVLGLLERKPDIVEPFHQAALAERVDVELDHAAIRASDLLRAKVDGDHRVGAARGIVDQLIDLLLRERDRQDAVLEAVVVEDVGEGRRDDAAEAEIEQRPWRVLAGGAAAEILPCDQDRRLGVRLPVQHEVGQRRALLVIAKLGEQALAEPGALDGLEVLLGDDHVGIDIDHGQMSGDPGQRGEFFRGMLLSLCSLCSAARTGFPVA